MKRLTGLAVVLLTPLLFAADGKKPGGPNTLSADEARAGWLLLFDGESTFGWKIDGEAKVEKGVLILGGEKETKAEPTAQFGNCGLAFEADWEGTQPPTFRCGALTLSLTPRTKGKFETRRTRVDVFPAAAAPPMRVTVPAGSKARLRAVKVLPMSRSGFFAPGALKSEQRMTPLFNGKDLKGWRALEVRGKKSNFIVTREGWLNIKDGPGDLQTEATFSDFVLQLECISNGKHLNSGVFLRAIPGKTWQGYEAQIRNQFTEKPTQKYTVEEYDPKDHTLVAKKTVESTAVDYGTGAIYRRVPARKGVAKDGEWFTLTVLARGRHFATWVDGVPVVDWTDNRPARDNAREGYRAAAGVISLQGHDPSTDLSFRNIRIAPLESRRRRE